MRRGVWWGIAVVVATIAVGCGESHPPGDDGGADDFDAGEHDASTVPGQDAGTIPDDDAGAPGDDASPPDLDAGPPESCDSPGVVEDVPCGNCGTVSRFCTASRVWEYAECEGEGVCAPGTIDAVECGNCGTQTARCTTACVWERTGGCTAEGECAPGTRTRSSETCTAPQTREFLCNDACTFEPASECSADACPTPGMLQEVPCGMCGTRERFCTSARVWEYGPCGGEGVCMPGTTGPVACGNCGTRTARCNTSCEWDGSGTCTGEGVCAPGTVTRSGALCPPMQTQRVQCTDSCTYTPLDACRGTVPVDVMVLLDVTGSHATYVRDNVANFGTRLVAPLLAIDDVAVGVAWYADFPIDPFGVTGDRPFEGGVQPTRTRAEIDAAFAAAPQRNGNDLPESAVEALSILAGGTPPASAIPLACSTGRTAGGCWRSGVRRVIVVYTDASSHNGPSPTSTALHSPYTTIPTAATWPAVRSRLMTDGTLLLVLYRSNSDGDAPGQYDEMLRDLGQPASDRIAADTLTTALDAVVARVRSIAMP
ncbi:vWA domain-containing protein [Sandaracinus amylolyticus]|nr:vWA domain-containing protein [Sandaracinus amylolyticus]